MATTKLTGKELKQIDYPEGRAIGEAQKAMEAGYKGKSKKFKLELLQRVVQNPALYLKHDQLGSIAKCLIIKEEAETVEQLNTKRIPYNTYGAEGIEPGAVNQMEIAMKLPVTHSGALMADAHQGYGLPIGGVLATKNAVIPYGVGVDIGCRMCMTLYDMPAVFEYESLSYYKKLLNDNSKFGNAVFKRPKGHDVLDRAEFGEINILKSLKDRAYAQIGTSGGGNHFVEFGVAEIVDAENEYGLPKGKYLAVLSHSGSRGLGANIARHYTKLAMDKCRLPAEAKHLAWLDLDTEDGQEYWLAMNLAGDYASACHHQIHERMAVSLGEKPLAMIENHHNFAWKELDVEGNEIIVHRKGATPAGKGVMGIIPGSMTSPGFIVRGKGEHAAINSASHGAGRVMSRRKAKAMITRDEVKSHLKHAGVHVIGSGVDEAPMVYKDIHQVMAAQQDLVEVVGTFTPKVVRMCGDDRFAEVD
ncbi:RtcB family protein [Fulvivirga maritima]|uniref:RtcB family protein n=1 Tax=Fulvivirga maritima TaxID=2904247 RepID=UPI001F3CC85D|nr:RtcB family protein [Fulvivirga maritima]UII28950.1 RtcB family protein [Fulvivirga maritima]